MPSPFVTTQGTQFNFGAQPFPVTGVNCYFLAYCSDQNRRGAMTVAKAAGTTVIRSCAFLAVENFTPGQVAFQ